jgi:histidine triad (HIT) family protein
MTDDFYCDEVLSGRTPVDMVCETENVLAFRHTRPSYPVHIVVIPKRHINSFVTLPLEDDGLLVEMLRVIQQVAAHTAAEHDGCRVITNIGKYQDSRHLHWHIVAGEPLNQAKT